MNITLCISKDDRTMGSIEEMLKEILENQKKVVVDLSQQSALIKNIENRIERIENESSKNNIQSEVPTALIRVLRGLAEVNKPVSAKEAAKTVSLSRNLTSGYLNRLSDIGYATKKRNLEGKGSRYLFKINYASIPKEIKRLLEEYKR